MELEHQQLDLRYEGLRRRSPAREKRLLASLAEKGQQCPVVVVAAERGDKHVVVDGYKRVRCLKRLKTDTVLATAWQLSEAEALILEQLMRAGDGTDPFEQGWLLKELRRSARPPLGQEALAQRFDKTKSWVCRRLGLVEELPEEIQDRVHSGLLAPYAAMKYLVPLARANRNGCVKLVEALGDRAPSSRQVEALCRAFCAGDRPSRERLLADPWLFLKVQEELKREEPAEKPPARLLLSDLGAIAAISRRASGRLREGIARRLTPEERSEVALCFAQAQADAKTLFHLCDKEVADARSGPAQSHP